MGETTKDIAKKFDLPERQTKIASIIKQSDKKYCICQSTDSTGFMIGCEYCEEWFHGECININQVQAKNIKKYFCDACIETNPGLQILYKKKPKALPGKPKPTTPVKSAKKAKPALNESPAKPAPKKCGPCEGCLRTENCGQCPNCRRADPNKPCISRECILNKKIESSSKESESDWTDHPTFKPISKKTKPAKTKKSGQKRRRSRKVIPRAPLQPESRTETSEEEDDVVKQCFAPNCQKTAGPGSKYCSMECGIALASDRLYLILPARIQEWAFKKPVAEEHNDRDLEDVKKQQRLAQQTIKELQAQRDKLDEHIARIGKLKFDPDFEGDNGDEEGLISCVSCAKEIATKDSLKHMEKCYNKFESQTSFGSIYKTNVEGTPLFCDFLNPTNQTYCKRLNVLCVEHTKEGKIGDTEVCGFPSDSEVKIGRPICNNSKKKCNKHYGWEKLRRAEIDMERVRQYLKLDELLEQERQLLQAKQDRGGVLGMLLNSTFDHELDDAFRAEQERQEKERELKERNQQDEIKMDESQNLSESSSSMSSEMESEQSDDDYYDNLDCEFVHLPSKRTKARDNAPFDARPKEVTASRLSVQK